MVLFLGIFLKNLVLQKMFEIKKSGKKKTMRPHNSSALEIR